MTFEEFFKAIHGKTPFPWQQEAARRLATGDAMNAVSVPTACGKTALIDAAVFAAALGGRRRVLFVIDRRVVVDEAYERSQKIAKALNGTQLGCNLGLDDIQAIRLRGGLHQESDWMHYPEKITIVISTVDQIGSRLLHRGYGVSPKMASVHAGFLGNDALLIIDEAHLSAPFVSTVQALRSYGADIQPIVLSATLGAATGAILQLGHEDRDHPVLRQRLDASKSAELREVRGQNKNLIATLCDEAERLCESSPLDAPVVGVMVNRVATARAVYTALKKRLRAVLLTGRIRPYDRDVLVGELLPAVATGRDRKVNPSPLFVVSTQTLEVGADIDLDALVTEAASLSALRQRFGRLDRLGELGATEAVIVRLRLADSKGNLKEEKPDPIYGEALTQAWRWLNDWPEKTNFGIAAWEQRAAEAPPPEEPRREAPCLLPSHVLALAVTGPLAPRIDVSPWLHGTQSGSADVAVIWRSDLVPGQESTWSEIAGLLPPISLEAMEVPIYAVQGWLEWRREQDVSDLEGLDLSSGASEPSDRPLLIWRGQDKISLGKPSDMRPGDTILLPAEYGGCDRFGWAPQSREPVSDIREACSAGRRGRHAVRLIPGHVEWLGENEEAVMDTVAAYLAAEDALAADLEADPHDIDEAQARLEAALTACQHPYIQSFKGWYTLDRHPLGGLVVTGRTVVEMNDTKTGGVAVALDDHLRGVEAVAHRLANGHTHEPAIRQAAALHDVGKQEPRFQVMLHGDELRAAGGPALAKSGIRSTRMMRAAYASSGLPRGFRHELASLEMADLTDPLVRYLVGTHHGHGRPWFPKCEDPYAPGAPLAELSSDWPEQFAMLLDRYGPWVLAGMESLLRSADARQSMLEQEQPEKWSI